MNKCSTPADEISEKNTKKTCDSGPRETTISIIRQFARVYRPAPTLGMPGYVLN